MAMKKKIDANRLNLKDEVVSINRVTKVVKGGKNMSFAALVVIGDPGEGVVTNLPAGGNILWCGNPDNGSRRSFRRHCETPFC